MLSIHFLHLKLKLYSIEDENRKTRKKNKKDKFFSFFSYSIKHIFCVKFEEMNR